MIFDKAVPTSPAFAIATAAMVATPEPVVVGDNEDLFGEGRRLGLFRHGRIGLSRSHALTVAQHGLTKAFLPFGLLGGSGVAFEGDEALLVCRRDDFSYFHKSI